MTIQLNNVGKRFNFEWILRNISYEFRSGTSYAILGPNGSGKSTLLQMISGAITPSDGSLNYSLMGKNIEAENFFRYIGLSAPYLELVEELTLVECIRFQHSFKKFVAGLSEDSILELMGLKDEKNKELKHFSSGMKQRLKLALAILADVPAVLLDEPTTNLDETGVNWYLNLMMQYTRDRIMIVSSNTEREYSFCTQRMDVTQYK